MKQIAFVMAALAAFTVVVAISIPASLRADEAATPLFVTKIPAGYREWRLISVAHEEGSLESGPRCQDHFPAAIRLWIGGSEIGC